MKKIAYFLWACDFTVGKQFILHFCTFLTFIHIKNLNEMMCDIMGPGPLLATPYQQNSSSKSYCPRISEYRGGREGRGGGSDGISDI